MHFINAVVIEIYKPIHAYESCMNFIMHVDRAAYGFNSNSKIGYIKWRLGEVEKSHLICVSFWIHLICV